MPDMILGDVFMRNYFVTFDKQKQKIAFATYAGMEDRMAKLSEISLESLIWPAGIIVLLAFGFVCYNSWKSYKIN